MYSTMLERRSTRRSVRQLADRKRASIYYEPDSNDDEFGEEDGGEQDIPAELEPPRKRQKRDRRSKPQTRSAVQSRKSWLRSKPKRKEKKPAHAPRKALGAPIKKKETKDWGPLTFKGPSDHKTPDWTSLPIEILREIFYFASQPMHEQTTTASANVTWLMQRARQVCRAFAMPALEAYYQSPYPLTNLQPHHLLELMRMPADKTYMNYKVKVKSLEIDVRRLAYSATGRNRLDLSLLVRELPQLQQLVIIHPVNTPPFRQMKIQTWLYPMDLFEALEDSGAKLKSWRWNRDMFNIEPLDVCDYMSTVHDGKAFEYLEHLVLCDFDVHDSGPRLLEPDRPVDKHRLAASISKLAHLKDLTFISCDAVMDDFLEQIPKNLERLELSNCVEVTTDMLMAYLLTGGSHLRELVLSYNPALNLMFLPHLKALCPRLEVLKMDLTYYSERQNYNDAWAMYDQLLTEESVPAWPATLRHLELINLQKWTAEAAQNLFRSLIGSAKDLRDLRKLIIKAHISIPWRDRAQFRMQWEERLPRVYLRRSDDPNTYNGSLRQFKLWKQAQAKGQKVTGPADLELDDETSTRRGLSHVRLTPRKPPPNVETFEDPGPSIQKPQRPARRSARVAELAESQSATPPAEESSADSDEDGEEDWRTQGEAFIQGLCQVVDIRIDDQRQREYQYTEANFLDSEPSGDEDWHSGAELSDDGYAW